MTIGQRILQARQEAGLSQRQLAGETITRNMLSAMEHDKAKPSLDTLQYLSEVLGRPVGWFLGEDTPGVPGFEQMVQARLAWDEGRYRECLALLAQVPPGEVLDREISLLRVLATLALAEQCMDDGRMPYARKLLENPVGDGCPYYTAEVARGFEVLRAKAGLSAHIPEDGTLFLRAEQALRDQRWEDALRYLEALDNRGDQWDYLMGEALFGLKRYDRAAECYHRVEGTMAAAVRRKLQLCYAALKDFEKAYYYATLE